MESMVRSIAATTPLKRWSTDELETAIYSGRLDNIQRFEAERILSDAIERLIEDSYGVLTMPLLGHSLSRWVHSSFL